MSANLIKKEKKKRGFMDGYKTYDTSGGFGSASEWKQAFNKRMSLDEAENILGANDPLTVLGLKANATLEQITKAFRKLAMLHHPDKNVGKEREANEKMQQLLAAYTLAKKRFKK